TSPRACGSSTGRRSPSRRGSRRSSSRAVRSAGSRARSCWPPTPRTSPSTSRRSLSAKRRPSGPSCHDGSYNGAHEPPPNVPSKRLLPQERVADVDAQRQRAHQLVPDRQEAWLVLRPVRHRDDRVRPRPAREDLAGARLAPLALVEEMALAPDQLGAGPLLVVRLAAPERIGVLLLARVVVELRQRQAAPVDPRRMVEDRHLDEAVVLRLLLVAELDVALLARHLHHPVGRDVEPHVAAVGDEDLVAGLAAPAVVGWHLVDLAPELLLSHRSGEG